MTQKTKNFIVITSIFPPTRAVREFAKLPEWQLIVVGDKKSPANWALDGVIYLGPKAQMDLGFSILKELPWNHYCRKMVGYLYAIKQGAELICDTDDDNEPKADWPALPSSSGKFKTLSAKKFANVYNQFTDEFVWPRGYPLNEVLSKEEVKIEQKAQEVGIWQFLADEDPDVDAIYRLTNNKQIYFDDKPPLVLEEGTVCPFNSQNTIFQKEFFPLLYLPAFVTFRFTDILRGLVAQPVLWKHGHRLGFGPATVVQKRNPHDYMRDFESEIPVYLHSEKVVDKTTQALIDAPHTLSEQLYTVYEALKSEGIVNEEEMELLSCWIQDLKTIARQSE